MSANPKPIKPVAANSIGAWTLELPKEPDTLYWFFGDIHGDLNFAKYSLVEVRKISNGVLLITDGQVINERDCIGFFQRVTPPELSPMMQRVLERAKLLKAKEGLR